MSLSLAEVEHIAQLAHLSLTAEEKERYRVQLSTILDYAQRLQELDTDSIPPTATILPIRGVMRPDEPQPSMPQAELLANAPVVAEEMFRVPPVLDQET